MLARKRTECRDPGGKRQSMLRGRRVELTLSRQGTTPTHPPTLPHFLAGMAMAISAGGTAATSTMRFPAQSSSALPPS